MSVARFIADQRARYLVPQSFTCALLGVSVSWFYKWITRAQVTDGVHTDTDRRREQLDIAVAAAFKKAKGVHGSPRLIADLRDLAPGPSPPRQPERRQITPHRGCIRQRGRQAPVNSPARSAARKPNTRPRVPAHYGLRTT